MRLAPPALAVLVLSAPLPLRAAEVVEVLDAGGDGAGNVLDDARGLAVGADGNLYVAGDLSDNVFEVTPEGVVTEILDASGDGAGNPLDGPREVAVGPDGSVYVTGRLSDNAFRITPAGVVTEIVDATGDGAGNPLDTPRGLAVDADGNVFVTGALSDNVLRVTPAGGVTEILDATGDGTSPLDAPKAVAVGPDGSAYVVGQSSHNVFRVTPSGTVTEVADSTGDGAGNPLFFPLGIVVRSDGTVYVAGASGDNAFRITPAGAVEAIIDASGDGTNPLDQALGIAVDPDGSAWVCGTASDNLFRIAPSGAIAQIVDASGAGAGSPLDAPRYVAAAPDGVVYVSGQLSDNVLRVEAPAPLPALSREVLPPWSSCSPLWRAAVRCGAPPGGGPEAGPEDPIEADSPARDAALRGAGALVGRLGGAPLARVALASLCALVGLAALHPIRDTDFGWHVALGRHIAEHHGVPDREPFTHTARGAPMVAHEWLSQLVLYGATRPAGILGLRYAHAAWVVGLLVGFYAMQRRAGVAPALAVFGVLVYALVASSRFEPRPQIFQLGFLMLLYHAVFVRRPRLTAARIAVIAAGVALWANFHAGAALFPALVGVALAVELAQRALDLCRPGSGDAGRWDAARLAALFGLCAAALLATPAGPRLVPYVLDTRRLNAGMVAEWAPIWDFFGDPANLPLELEAFAAVAVATAVAIAWRLRAGAWLGGVAVVACLAALPATGQRFVDVYFAPVLFCLVSLEAWLRSAPRPRLRAGVHAAAVAGALALAPLAIGSQVDWRQLGLWLRETGNFQPVTFPEGAVRFLDQVRPRGRLFNIQRWGGYVLLRTGGEIPVFIDGRFPTVGSEVARDALVIERRLPGSFEKLDAWGVGVLLVPRGWMTDAIAQDRGWRAVFENWNAGVYVRVGSRGDLARCAAYYARRGIPFDPQRGFDGAAARRANPRWAHRFRVEPRHVNHFRLWGNPIGVSPGQWVRGF